MNDSTPVVRPPRRACPPAARTAAAIIATAGLALPAAACGGGSPGSHVAQLSSTATRTSTSSPNASEASAQQNGALAFAGCMRSHGVSNWPDPEGNGRFDKAKLTPQQLGASDSRVQAAQKACQHLLPTFGSGMTPAQFQQMKAEALRFSRCIQGHGFPNYPDPGGDGREPDPASVESIRVRQSGRPHTKPASSRDRRSLRRLRRSRFARLSRPPRRGAVCPRVTRRTARPTRRRW
jgi:hypothetical protein